MVPATRRAAGIWLILLLVAVFPANIQMLSNWRTRGATWWAEGILWLRLPLQLVFIWWAWGLSRVGSRDEKNIPGRPAGGE